MVNMKKKDRTKNKPTKKQNKWNDPFYYRSNNSELPERCIAGECGEHDCKTCILSEDVEFTHADIDLENERNRKIR